MGSIANIRVENLKRIANPKGDIFHALKASEHTFAGFGEAYFSKIEPQAVKGWKRHRWMTLNLIVPVGSIKFVFFEDGNIHNFFEVICGTNNYCRITVPPGIWMAFQGIENINMVLNIASIEHDPTEADTKSLEEVNYRWTS
jgi:dTDP-4-dehydrorhamnose 3,5-epimerase